MRGHRMGTAGQGLVPGLACCPPQTTVTLPTMGQVLWELGRAWLPSLSWSST